VHARLGGQWGITRPPSCKGLSLPRAALWGAVFTLTLFWVHVPPSPALLELVPAVGPRPMQGQPAWRSNAGAWDGMPSVGGGRGSEPLVPCRLLERSRAARGQSAVEAACRHAVPVRQGPIVTLWTVIDRSRALSVRPIAPNRLEPYPSVKLSVLLSRTTVPYMERQCTASYHYAAKVISSVANACAPQARGKGGSVLSGAALRCALGFGGASWALPMERLSCSARLRISSRRRAHVQPVLVERARELHPPPSPEKKP